MANSKDIDVAEAIKDEIAGHAFDVTVDLVKRSYANPEVDVPLIDGQIRVDVYPIYSTPLPSRGDKDWEVHTGVVIRKKFATNEIDDNDGGVPVLASLDELLKLRADIYEFFAPNFNEADHDGRALTAMPDAVLDLDLTNYPTDESYDVELLRTAQVFKSWLELVYIAS